MLLWVLPTFPATIAAPGRDGGYRRAVPDRPLAAAALRRRTAILGLAAAALATGCDTGDDLGEGSRSASPSRSSEPSPSPSASASAESARTPDQALVDEVLAELTGALAVLAQARKAPLLRRPVAQLLRAHRRHVEVLEGDAVVPDATGPTPDPDVSLRSVRRSETTLQAALVDAAGRAESGALAKLLASMSASVTQHLGVLPQKAG